MVTIANGTSQMTLCDNLKRRVNAMISKLRGVHKWENRGGGRLPIQQMDTQLVPI
jgi:hypothetical protein